MSVDRQRRGIEAALSWARRRADDFYEEGDFGRFAQTNVPQAPRSNGWRCRVIKAATAKEGFFAITFNDVDAIGVIVSVELERGAAEWKLNAGVGAETSWAIS